MRLHGVVEFACLGAEVKKRGELGASGLGLGVGGGGMGVGEWGLW